MMTVRPARAGELEALSDLCLRSKAIHGYSPEMLEAFRQELSLTESDLAHDAVLVAEGAGSATGVAHVSVGRDGCYLEKLFVEPDHTGQGTGRILMRAAIEAARKSGATEMIIESDPGAVPFYRAMGARPDGEAESGSIPGRYLPRLVLAL